MRTPPAGQLVLAGSAKTLSNMDGDDAVAGGAESEPEEPPPQPLKMAVAMPKAAHRRFVRRGPEKGCEEDAELCMAKQ